jgi:hypothetical protein
MTINETKNHIDYNGKFTAVEVYEFTDKRHSIHTDSIRELDPNEYNDNSEVIADSLMDEEEYNNTILANTSTRFTDIYNKDDKVLVIVIKK